MSTVLRPLSIWAAIAIRQGAWWQLCKITRFWECVSPVGVLWWAWLLMQPGSLFQTNVGFADLAHYAPETTWGLWTGFVAGVGILAALLGPPTVRAIGQATQMWMWTMISVHLSAAAPRIPGLPRYLRFLPYSTGGGLYAILAIACCVALAFLVPLVLNDALGCGRRLSRAVSRPLVRSLVRQWTARAAWTWRTLRRRRRHDDSGNSNGRNGSGGTDRGGDA